MNDTWLVLGWMKYISGVTLISKYDTTMYRKNDKYHYPIIFRMHFVTLNYWGRVTHISVSKLIIIGSDNGLSPGQSQSIIWTNAVILLIGSLETNSNEILIEFHTFSFTMMYLKMSRKWRSFCLSPNVLTVIWWFGSCSVVSSNCITRNMGIMLWTYNIEHITAFLIYNCQWAGFVTLVSVYYGWYNLWEPLMKHHLVCWHQYIKQLKTVQGNKC